MRTKHYSLRTEESYSQWVRRFSEFHNSRPLSELGAPEVREFLEYLAMERNVGASTQKQALNALVFFYGQVIERGLGELGIHRAQFVACTYARTSLKAFVNGKIEGVLLLSVRVLKSLCFWKGDTYLLLNAQWRSREKRNKCPAPAGPSAANRSEAEIASRRLPVGRAARGNYAGFFLAPQRSIQLPGSHPLERGRR